MVPATQNPRFPMPPQSSAVETVLLQPDGTTVWQVDTRCGEHRIMVWGPSRQAALEKAYRMAARIAREESLSRHQ